MQVMDLRSGAAPADGQGRKYTFWNSYEVAQGRQQRLKFLLVIPPALD
jgi:hypothetical protein